MALGKLDGVELPAAADMHVHLREGAMTDLVVYVDPMAPTNSTDQWADEV